VVIQFGKISHGVYPESSEGFEMTRPLFVCHFERMREIFPNGVMVGKANCTTTGFIGLHIVLSIFPLFEILTIEFPILVRLLQPRKETLALLLFRDMEKELDYSCAVAMQV
jgi:hypothetical protein